MSLLSFLVTSVDFCHLLLYSAQYTLKLVNSSVKLAGCEPLTVNLLLEMNKAKKEPCKRSPDDHGVTVCTLSKNKARSEICENKDSRRARSLEPQLSHHKGGTSTIVRAPPHFLVLLIEGCKKYKAFEPNSAGLSTGAASVRSSPTYWLRVIAKFRTAALSRISVPKGVIRPAT
ncbi:hypothetical protein C8J56DRAFT_890302 [Mycena floridula]|nr:hypothetical protein C8J56DRAFT_890302 [Mycena floridula]